MAFALFTATCLACLLIARQEAAGVPACPAPATVTQPDGQKIQIYLRGDEFLHWHEDGAGFTILPDRQTGAWAYAVKDGTGKLVPGVAIVGRDDPKRLGLPQRLLPDGAVERSSSLRERREKVPSKQDGPVLVPKTGTLKNLVLLVEFSDKPHTRARAEYEALFNTFGYNVDGAVGSVKDYYQEVSYHTLDIQSTVVDWITLDNGYAYYGADAGGTGNDVHPQQMVAEALAKLAARGFDFSTMDADGDGWVDGLTVIHSGGGQEYTGNDANYIWSHKWNLTTQVTYGGKILYYYHTEPERRGFDSTPSTWGITRIGVICHETGHLLGLPDLYDATYTSKGVGDFCLMGHGSWNGNDGTQPAGRQPAHLSAWCKKTLAWLSPAIVTGAATYPVPAVETNATVYQLSGLFPSTQYFLIENRQGYGFDASLPGSTRGLLIWHIDETQANNNDRTHYKVDLEEASGTQHLEQNSTNGDDADYYRQGNNTVFSSSSTPTNRSYSGTPLGLNVGAVSASGPNMTFNLTAAVVPSFVVAWGENFYGQTNVPPGLTNVMAIAAGGEHSLALRRSGTVVAWGDNTYGQTNVPLGLTNTVGIAAGDFHSLALKGTGTVVAWGYDYFDQTNIPVSLTNAVAIAAGGLHNLALKRDGTVAGWGCNGDGQTTIPPGLTNAAAIAAGDLHSLALKGDGTVLAWGAGTTNSGLDPDYGQSVVPGGLTNVVAIAGGGTHSLALKGDGTVVAWGYNGYGETNVPPGLTNVVAIAGGSAYSLVLKGNGTVVAWGRNDYGETNVPAGLTNVVAIAAGGWHNLALRNDGSPVVLRPPVDLVTCNSRTAAFSVIAVGAPPLSYYWRKNGSDLPEGYPNNAWGTTTPTLTLTRVSQSDAASYSVVVANSVGSVASSAATLTVIDPPEIITQPASRTNLAGTTATFSVVVSGTAPLQYQWRKGETNLIGGTDTTLTLTNVGRRHAGVYAVLVTNICGSLLSSNATLLVRVPQRLGMPCLLPHGTCVIISGDADGGLLSTNDLANFDLYASTNLASWVLLTNCLSLTNGQLRLCDPASTNFPQRFYQINER